MSISFWEDMDGLKDASYNKDLLFFSGGCSAVGSLTLILLLPALLSGNFFLVPEVGIRFDSLFGSKSRVRGCGSTTTSWTVLSTTWVTVAETCTESEI